MADDGFALAWTAVPTVGKRVFLRAVSTIPTVMRCMTPSPATVKKAAYGRSKSPAFAGTKKATRVFLIIMQGITPMANLFFPGASRAFFTAVGGLFAFVAFQPAYGQARRSGAVNIRELALVDISAPLWRIGRSPEKLQIFLCYSPLPFCPVRELKSLAIVPPPSRGWSSFLLCLRWLRGTPPPWEGWNGASVLDGTHPRQLCRSCDFIAQG